MENREDDPEVLDQFPQAATPWPEIPHAIEGKLLQMPKSLNLPSFGITVPNVVKLRRQANCTAARTKRGVGECSLVPPKRV